jgi:RNA recognition motif-containing protein
MRDLKNVDANKVGKSKEYGFVSFTTHEDALQALRSLNNNPNIFTKAKVCRQLGKYFTMDVLTSWLFAVFPFF